MPEAQIAKAVQLLDLVLEFFADEDHGRAAATMTATAAAVWSVLSCISAASIGSRQDRRSLCCRMRCLAPAFRSCTSTTGAAGP
jgi:hypothetical protein